MERAQCFDYDDYVRGFRAACAARGIDPVEGATVYQVANLTADQRRASRKAELGRWWQRDDLWEDCPPYRSETEQDAIWRLFNEAYLIVLLRLLRVKRQRNAMIPLRELHQMREK